MRIETTTATIAAAAWGVAADQVTPNHGTIEPDGAGWYRYAGTPYPVRRLTGAEAVAVTLAEGRNGWKAVAFDAESWVIDRLGQPGVAVFSVRQAYAVAAALLEGEK